LDRDVSELRSVRSFFLQNDKEIKCQICWLTELKGPVIADTQAKWPSTIGYRFNVIRYRL
jgi:hypothetical protein